MSALTEVQDFPPFAAMATLRSHSEQKVHTSADLSEEGRRETNSCCGEPDSNNDMRTTSVETEAEHHNTTEDEEDSNRILPTAARREGMLPIGEEYTRAQVPSGYLGTCNEESDTPAHPDYSDRRACAWNQLHTAIAAGGQKDPLKQSEIGLRAAKSRPDNLNALQLHPDDFQTLKPESTDVSISDAVSHSYPSCSSFPSVYAFLVDQGRVPLARSGLLAGLSDAAKHEEAGQQQLQHSDKVRTGETKRTISREEDVRRQRLSPELLEQLGQSQLGAAGSDAGAAGARDIGGSQKPAASGPDISAEWRGQHRDMGGIGTREEGEVVRLADDDEISFDLSSTDEWAEESGSCFPPEGNGTSETATLHTKAMTEVLARDAETARNGCDGNSRVHNRERSNSSSSSSAETLEFAETAEKARSLPRETGGGSEAKSFETGNHRAQPPLRLQTAVSLQTQSGDGSSVGAAPARSSKTSPKEQASGSNVKSRACCGNNTGTQRAKQTRPGSASSATKQETSGRERTPMRRRTKKQPHTNQKEQRAQHFLQMPTLRPQGSQTRPQQHQQHGIRQEQRQQQQRHPPLRSLGAAQQVQAHPLKQHRQRRKQHVAFEETAPHAAGDCRASAVVEVAVAADPVGKRRVLHDTELYSRETKNRGAALAAEDLESSPTRSPSLVPVFRGRSPPTRRLPPAASHAPLQHRNAAAKSHRVSSCGSNKSSTSDSSHSSRRSPPPRLPATQLLKAISRMACEHAERRRSSRGPCWNDLPPAAQRKILEVVQQQRSLITSRAQIRKAVEAMQRAIFTSSSFSGTANGKNAGAGSAAAALVGSASSGTAATTAAGNAAVGCRRGVLQERRHQGRREGLRQPSVADEKAKSLMLRRGIHTASARGIQGCRGSGCSNGRRSIDMKQTSSGGEAAERKKGWRNGSTSTVTSAPRSSSVAALGVGTSGAARSPSARSSGSATAARSAAAVTCAAAADATAAPASAASSDLRGRKGAEKRGKPRSSSWHHCSRRLGASVSAHSLHGSNSSSSSGNRLLCPHGLRYKSLCAHCGSSVLLPLQEHDVGNSGAHAAVGALQSHSKVWEKRARSSSRSNKQHLDGSGAGLGVRSSSTSKSLTSSAESSAKKGDNPVFQRLWNHALSRQRAHSAASLRRRNSSVHPSKSAATASAVSATDNVAPRPGKGGTAASSLGKRPSTPAAELAEEASNSLSQSAPAAAGCVAAANVSAPVGTVSAGAATVVDFAVPAAAAGAASSVSSAVDAGTLPSDVDVFLSPGAGEEKGKSMGSATARFSPASSPHVSFSSRIAAVEATREDKGGTAASWAFPGKGMMPSDGTAKGGDTRGGRAEGTTSAHQRIVCMAVTPAAEHAKGPGPGNSSSYSASAEGKHLAAEAAAKEKIPVFGGGTEDLFSPAKLTDSPGKLASSAGSSAPLALFGCPMRLLTRESRSWQQQEEQAALLYAAPVRKQQPRQCTGGQEPQNTKAALKQHQQHRQHYAVAAEEGRSEPHQQRQFVHAPSQELQLPQVARQTFYHPLQQQESLKATNGLQRPRPHATSAEQQWKRQQEAWLAAASLHYRKQQQQQTQQQQQQQQSPLLVYNHAVPVTLHPVAPSSGPHTSSSTRSSAAAAPARLKPAGSAASAGAVLQQKHAALFPRFPYQAPSLASVASRTFPFDLPREPSAFQVPRVASTATVLRAQPNHWVSCAPN